MPRNKSPKKRKQHKPGKPGRSPADGRIPYRRYPKRFIISAPPEHGHESPHEFFYDSAEEVIQHCVHHGLSFFSTHWAIRLWSRLSAVLSNTPVMQRGPDMTVPIAQ